jgi:hypothetical protein
MFTMSRTIALALVLAAGTAAAAHPEPSAPAGSSHTVNMQSTDPQRAFFDGLERQYYDLTVAEYKAGGGKFDADSYEKKSYALFRSYASAHGASPDGLQNHLKAIPRQVVQIVKEDPKVLDSQKAFIEALEGPPPPP